MGIKCIQTSDSVFERNCINVDNLTKAVSKKFQNDDITIVSLIDCQIRHGTTAENTGRAER